ncbi:uncharacterized protein EV420DRAFT_1643926 [Desarmillaria tabescens]|uniref:DUF6534 domain-containing protein n=1 Tax=Armillaria tabescens TaxID=1929756 RepID=A0AA39KCS8_ARMTA|nr:uncharacterized protein EV420DRAFT_1643926 [Desarmillaria tabescens]KAK0457590.1 hypothetical protein EV420DRAFT_1643926 [Desarmillaria tabescens]
MSSQSSPEIPSLGDTFGALFVGATIAAILFGIMNLQVLIYYKRYPNDWSLYRHSVALFWFLDTVHVALGTHALYYYLIDMSGNLRGALEANIIWSMRVQLVVKVWTIVFVQGVYAIRLWKLGRHFHKIIPWFVFLAVAASLGAGIFLSNDIYVTPNLASVSIITASIYTFYSMIITADVIIALMMTYYLHKSRAAMHFASTADLLLGLMRMVLATGIATSACSLFSLFTYIMWPKTLIFVAIDFILPRLYINSLLAMFNYRHQRSSNTSTSEDRRHSIPNVLQFAPNPSESHSKETNISIPLSEIQRTRSSAESGISKGTVDSPV